MKIKNKIVSKIIFGMIVCYVANTDASKEIIVTIPPAAIRMPEGIITPSSDVLARSNYADEFTALDADNSAVFHVAAQQENAAVLEKEGLVVHDSEQSDEGQKTDIISPSVVVHEVPPIPAEIIENHPVPPTGELEQGGIQESLWIVNPEHRVYFSLESKEAKELLEFVSQSCDDANATVRMSLNGRDVLTFIAIAKRYAFDAVVVDVGLRRFFNKFKTCLLIDDAVIHQILPELVNLLEPYLDYEKNISMAISAVQRDVEELMCECFLKYTHMLSTRPNDFITKISRNIARTAYMSLESDEIPHTRSRHDRERLRFLSIQFLNLLFDRVVWPPYAFESIWPSFVRMGSYVCDFAQKNVIIHMDDFKDIFSTLVQRFIFYINLHVNVLPSGFFRLIQSDLGAGTIFFLEYPEHADLKKHFEYEINAAYLRALAHEKMISVEVE
ncbi:hypothetical protein FJ366_03655 [Candidatus Dependentiae bacterium]|nr:hypothetical protein [Candidatus Dependentiae bacterium]